MKIQNQPLRFHKQWLAFNKMMLFFKLGKTGIYAHPDFVMLDWKTYRKLTNMKPTKIFIDEPKTQDTKGDL